MVGLVPRMLAGGIEVGLGRIDGGWVRADGSRSRTERRCVGGGRCG